MRRLTGYDLNTRDRLGWLKRATSGGFLSSKLQQFLA